MARELVISAYLIFFQILFTLCKLFPQKKKTVCVASFGDNIFFTIRSIRELSNEEIIVLKDRNCNYPFDPTSCKVLPFEKLFHPLAYLQSIYHLATATTILVDNYFGFLAVTKFKEGTTCIQLWHAVGAIKKFGLMDPSIKSRNQIAKNRFQKVYNRFDYTIVGSEKMANVFRQSFGVSPHSILRTGIPRTDIFYNSLEKQQIYQHMKTLFPCIKNKKVILYAPTFRDHQLENYELAFDLKKLHKELSEEYVLFIKQHPSVSFVLHEEYNGFIYNVSNYYDTNHIFLITDLLITDYSSVAFEYALLEKPIIFYAYDMEEYRLTSGLMNNYENQMPGPVVKTTEEIIQAIKERKFNQQASKKFANDWNEYSTGNSSLNLARIVTNFKEEKEEKAYI